MPNLLQGGRGRPLHPMLVHFPVALYPTSLVFDALSHLSDDGNPFVRGAFTLIVIALVVSALAVAAGFADFLPIENGTRTWRVAVLHMSVQLVTAGLFLANAVLRGRDLDVTATPTGPIILSLVGLLTLTVGAPSGASWSTATAAGSSSTWSPPRSSRRPTPTARRPPASARSRGRQAVLGRAAGRASRARRSRSAGPGAAPGAR